MLRLLKYELRKTLMSKLILLGVTLIAQVVFLAGLWGKKDETLAIGAVLLFFIAITGIALMGILSVATLHRDMNSKQGYMLFMTPNSCYKILGAKVLECSISILLAGAFFFSLGWLDFSLLLGEGTNKQIWDMFNEMIQAINREIVLDAAHISALVFSLLAAWLCTITTAYLSDVVSSSLLNGKKANWLVTCILFVALNWGISALLRLIPSTLDVIPQLVWSGAASLVLGGVMYVVAARLMEKYLSV
uniref:Uncharacterized protein n=1 Tax=uncultured bacterium Contig12 TaxID=1393397 RepID=W0FIU3_9BACT|nr:conserved hypothetical protein [uncultured bacterium Contig12]